MNLEQVVDEQAVVALAVAACPVVEVVELSAWESTQSECRCLEVPEDQVVQMSWMKLV